MAQAHGGKGERGWLGVGTGLWLPDNENENKGALPGGGGGPQGPPPPTVLSLNPFSWVDATQ